MGKPIAAAIPISSKQYRLLQQEFGRRSIAYQTRTRIQIILLSSQGQSIGSISRDLRLTRYTVRTWRNRWQTHYEECLKFEQGMEQGGFGDRALLQKILEILNDQPRSGKPKEITLAEEQQIVALSCEHPQDYGLVMNSWTQEMLARTAVAQGIVAHISAPYVGRILKKTGAAT